MSRRAALQAEDQELVSKARALLDKPRATPAETDQANDILAKSEIIKARLKSMDKLASIDAASLAANDSAALPFGISTAQLNRTFSDEIRLIRAWGNFNPHVDGGDMSVADRAEWDSRYMSPTAAGSTTAPGAGGYSIAPAFMAELLIAMKSQCAMRFAADSFTTTTGAPLTWPEMDDRAQSGRLLTNENTTLAAATDAPFAGATFGGYTFVSDVLPVSNQLMQDSAFDFGKLLVKALASRLARAENPYFTTGTGAGQPQGVLTAAAAGTVAPVGSTVTVASDDMVNLLHSVDPAYRPGASWMMHDTTLQALRKVKDTTGRPLFQMYDTTAPAGSISGGTVLGYPVVINQDMPVMAANAKSILFGAFSAYKIRTVVDLRFTVLRERFADAFQTGFIASIRSDGRLASAAAPIRYLQNSAT